MKKKSLFASRVDKHSVVLESGRRRARESAPWKSHSPGLRARLKSCGRIEGPNISGFDGNPRIPRISASSQVSRSGPSFLHLVLQASSALPKRASGGPHSWPARGLHSLKDQSVCLPPPNPEELRRPGSWALRAALVHAVLGTLVVLNDSAAVPRNPPCRVQSPPRSGDSWLLSLLLQPSFSRDSGNSQERQEVVRLFPGQFLLSGSQFKGHFPGADFPGPADKDKSPCFILSKRSVIFHFRTDHSYHYINTSS